jgi:hypothetical protein
MARRVRGIGKVRRQMKGLPDAMAEQLRSVLKSGGRALKSAISSKAPKGRTGRLRAGIDFKVYPKTVRMRVGLLKTKAGRSELFYGRIQDLGRTAQTKSLRYRVANPKGGIRKLAGKRVPAKSVSHYPMHIRAMAGKKFVTGSYPQLRQAIGASVRGIWARALDSGEGGDD